MRTKLNFFRTAAIALTASLFSLNIAGCPVESSNNNDNANANENTNGDTSAKVSTPPVAVAGDSQTVIAGDQVVLSGVGSTDPNGERLTFIWRQTDGTPSVNLINGFSIAPRFFAPNVTSATALTFRLTVVNSTAAADSEVTITVMPR